MNLKCNYCDPVFTKEMKERGDKPIRSINTKTDDFVKDEKGKYYHNECYVLYLMNRKKINEEDAIQKLKEVINLNKNELNKLNYKNEFYTYIKEFYDTSLPAYYCTQISNIVSGKSNKVNEPIAYEVLLDIYKHMERYLKKNAMNKHFKNIGQHMNYDLAVVIGNYGDYKKFKAKQKQNQNDKVDILKSIKEQVNVNKIYKQKDSDNYSIMDDLDDLLL